MMIEERNRCAVLLDDEPAAAFAGATTRTEELRPAQVSGAQRRAAVELQRRISGHPQRALLGGSFTPQATGTLVVRIMLSAELAVGAIPACPSRFADPLVAGLPPDFADAVLAGLAHSAVIGPGELVVDRAAYDELASTETAFRNVAELLAVVLADGSSASGQADVRRRMRRWS